VRPTITVLATRVQSACEHRQGAKLHYFSRYFPEFDGLLASTRLVGDAAR